MTPSLYWRVTHPAVRRAMSLQDCNPASATYGCCDRSYWQYRTIASFPAGTMQQVALPFAVLFGTAFPGNQWHQQRDMFERARAAMLFWARSQHPSGTVDEWYRNEHGYCATAFTTFGIAEACLLLHASLASSDRDEIVAALRRGATWLGDRFNDEVMNQNLAASAALWNVHLVTGDSRFKAAFEKTWRRTLANQDDEGWFVEYGGADLGYSLLALDLLAALDRRGWSDAAAAAASLARFIASFAVGGADLAGRLGSRGTEHSFPFGAEALAASIPACRTVAAHLRSAIEADRVSDPRAVDDRYLAYFYLPSFVLACSLGDRPITPEHAASSTTFPSSGFRIWRGRGGDVVCSMRRNAAFNLYAPDSPVHRNLGYWIETISGQRYASCAWGPDNGTAEERPNDVVARGTFLRVDDSLPLVRHEVAFRATTQWLFRQPAIAEPFHRFIKRRKITRRTAVPLTFTRELAVGGGGLLVRDVLRTRGKAPTLRTVTPVGEVEVHSPSARLSGASANDVIGVSSDTAAAWAARINQTGELTLVSTYEVCDGRLRFAGIHEASNLPERAVAHGVS